LSKWGDEQRLFCLGELTLI